MAHKILIVDDDKINVSLIKFGLAEKRYEICYAYDGDEGLIISQREKPDLIILDIYMPNMNGYDFIRELKEKGDGSIPPILMVTANDMMESDFKLEGAKGYFVKPIDLEKLVSKIVECLGENPY